MGWRGEEKKFFKGPVIHDGSSYIYLFHLWKQDVSIRITGLANIEVICKMRLFFNGQY